MEIGVAVVKLHKNTFLKVKAFQAHIVLDEAEHGPGIWKTWLLAATDQLYDSGKVGLSFCVFFSIT